MKVPIYLACVLVSVLTGCAGTGPRSQTDATRPSGVVTSPSQPPALVPAPTATGAAVAQRSQVESNRVECVPMSAPPVPRPRSASELPGAPRTTVSLVGTVCSAATGRPVSGARVTAELMERFCAEGHQPWRCGGSSVTDEMGHYEVAVFDPAAYSLTIARDGYQTGGGVVRAIGPGVVTANWMLVPAVR